MIRASSLRKANLTLLITPIMIGCLDVDMGGQEKTTHDSEKDTSSDIHFTMDEDTDQVAAHEVFDSDESGDTVFSEAMATDFTGYCLPEQGDTASDSDIGVFDAGVLDTHVPDGSYPDACWDGSTCADMWDLTVEAVVPRFMLLLDRSSSEPNEDAALRRWNETRHAVTGLVNRFGCTDRLALGVDVFPSGHACDVGASALLDTAASNGENIYNRLSLSAPGKETPLYSAMARFLNPSYAPHFASSDSPSYLIVVSSGPDSCRADPSPPSASAADAAVLGALADSLGEERGIHAIAIGVGDAIDPEQLNAIAKNGGTDYESYLPAVGHAEAKAALHEIVSYLVPCEFELRATQKREGLNYLIDLEYLEFFIDGDLLPQNTGCTGGTGWDWVEAEKRIIFCDETCNEITERGKSHLTVVTECIPYIIPI